MSKEQMGGKGAGHSKPRNKKLTLHVYTRNGSVKLLGKKKPSYFVCCTGFFSPVAFFFCIIR